MGFGHDFVFDEGLIGSRFVVNTPFDFVVSLGVTFTEMLDCFGFV